MSDAIEQLLKDKDRAGAYLTGPDTRPIAEAAQAAGLALWRVDIGHVHDKQGFTGLVAKALAFPEWFGGNWDAFEDCLGDLSWHPAPGYVLLLEHGKHFGAGHKQEFLTAVEVLDGVAEYWQGQGKPFWAIVSGPEGWDAGLPQLPLA
ncbi:MAG: barstar family protein [Burkholderiales bacterium]|nr:barstar family protein [Burkholderiales bacterium]